MKPLHMVIAVKNFTKTSIQFHYVPYLPFWFSICIHDYIERQTNKYFPIISNNISPPLSFYENATHFICRTSMDTNEPISPSSQGNAYTFVIIDSFTHSVVTEPAPHLSF